MVTLEQKIKIYQDSIFYLKDGLKINNNYTEYTCLLIKNYLEQCINTKGMRSRELVNKYFPEYEKILESERLRLSIFESDWSVYGFFYLHTAIDGNLNTDEINNLRIKALEKGLKIINK